MQVNHAIDLDFSTGVRTLMRQDPDIIMIGEIRDLETAEMAIQAALTGHLVLSTLHTNDSPSSVSRLLELGAPAYLVKATLRGIMSQRLVRILCPHCKRAVPTDPAGWRELVQPFDLPMPEQTFEAVGCKLCRDTGYLGRRGIYEVLVNSPAVQDEIMPPASTRAACAKSLSARACRRCASAAPGAWRAGRPRSRKYCASRRPSPTDPPWHRIRVTCPRGSGRSPATPGRAFSRPPAPANARRWKRLSGTRSWHASARRCSPVRALPPMPCAGDPGCCRSWWRAAAAATPARACRGRRAVRRRRR
jgi:hypothetical protein